MTRSPIELFWTAKNLLSHSAGKICSSVGVVPADILSQNISQELTSDAKDLGNSLRSPKPIRCSLVTCLAAARLRQVTKIQLTVHKQKAKVIME